MALYKIEYLLVMMEYWLDVILYFNVASMGKIHIWLVLFVCMTLRCDGIIITIVFRNLCYLLMMVNNSNMFLGPYVTSSVSQSVSLSVCQSVSNKKIILLLCFLRIKLAYMSKKVTFLDFRKKKLFGQNLGQMGPN